jgi:hypothetical protein
MDFRRAEENMEFRDANYCDISTCSRMNKTAPKSHIYSGAFAGQGLPSLGRATMAERWQFM